MRAVTPLVGAEHKAVKQFSTLFRLLEYLKPYRKQIPIALMFVLYGSATQAIGPFLIGRSIDQLVNNGTVAELMQILGILAIIYISGVFAIREQIYRVGSIMQQVLAQFRHDIFTKIQSLPISFFDRSEAGDLMSRLINDVSTLNQAFGQTVAQMLGQLFTLIGIIIAMLSIDLRLGLISNLIIPLMLITTGLFARWARSKFRITRQTISEMSIKWRCQRSPSL
jgi:ATP-binding cassette subfamily B multidrug efflux pump